MRTKRVLVVLMAGILWTFLTAYGAINVYGHDGSNEPAINSALRINPANGDAIIVLVTGNPTLASSIGNEWTLWQTGVPDFLMLGRAYRSAIMPLIVGFLFIAAMCVLFWERQRRMVRVPA